MCNDETRETREQKSMVVENGKVKQAKGAYIKTTVWGGDHLPRIKDFPIETRLPSREMLLDSRCMN